MVEIKYVSVINRLTAYERERERERERREISFVNYRLGFNNSVRK